MRIILTRIDILRRTAIRELAGFCDALVSQFQDIAAAANSWAAMDHNDDGTHGVVRIGITGTTVAPSPIANRMSLYYDGTDLKVVRPDGTTGTVTIV